MSLDTRAKRQSAIHVGLPWRGMLPVADATISAADRLQVATFYAGIAFPAAVVTALVAFIPWLRRRRR